MAGQFTWLSVTQGVAQLAARLAIDFSSPNVPFWTQAELQLYIFRALQQYNILTNTWKIDFQFKSTNLWNSLGSLDGSPRLRTTTDADSYTMLQYYLLENPTGASSWTGTTQFSLPDLVTALQTRRNEILQITAANDVLLQNIPITPNTRRTLLSDTTLDISRVRYIPVQGDPTTLYRDDTVALEWFESPLYQLPSGTPQTFQLSSEPPMAFDVDIAPDQPGVYEAIVSQSGEEFDPPNVTLLGIPNDWAFILEYAALADLLGRESEATDRERAEYCMKRYQDYLGLITKTPWIMLGSVNGVACTVDSLEDTDRYSVGWDNNPSSFGPVIVTAGIDTFAAPVGSSIAVTCLGNAPLLDSTETYLQVSRDQWDTVLDLAQSNASLKMGGAEWKQALELEARAIKFCAAENSRLKSSGNFSDVILQRGGSQDRAQARYNNKDKSGVSNG